MERAEGVEGPSPGPVFGGNGRALMGPKGPYLLLVELHNSLMICGWTLGQPSARQPGLAILTCTADKPM